MESRQLERLSGLAAKPAMRVRMVMGAEKPGLFGRRFVTATSFQQAAEIAKTLHGAGIAELDVVLVGWQSDGYEGNLPRRWPPDRHLGGPGGLRNLAREVHGLGGRLFLEDDYTLGFLVNRGFSPLTDVIMRPSLLPYSDLVPVSEGDDVPQELRRARFLLNVGYATDRFVRRDGPRLAELGVDGIEVRWAGELLLPDANP